MDTQVVVIGSGPAGAMSALGLVERGVPVVMLESGETLPGGLLVRASGRNVYRRGPRLPDVGDYTTSGDPATVWRQALAPGGLSNFWTGAVPRFAPDDFDEGARLHERYRWPITYDELAPYYEQTESILGVTGDVAAYPALPAPLVEYPRQLPPDWQRLAEAAKALGQGLTPTPMAEGSPWAWLRRGTPFNSFTQIVKHLLGFPNFQLRLGVHVLRIECVSHGRNATGVLVCDRSTGRQERVEASAVIVAAGALNSTKLLLESTTTAFPDGLGNTHGVLGRYLHDHPKDWFELEMDTPLKRLPFSACLTRTPYGESLPLCGWQCTIVNARSTREKAMSLLGTRSRWLGAVVFGTMIPTEEGFVRLHPTARDRFGLPLLDIHLRYGAGVSRNTASARERLVRILENAGLRSHVSFALPMAEPPGQTVHFAGTIRMHDSPCYGMLDRWNRLHSVPNVLVTDASCFTTGAEKNPTLTVMAIAARAAHKLAADLKSTYSLQRQRRCVIEHSAAPV